MTDPILHTKKMSNKSLYLKFHPTDDLLDSKNFTNIRKVRCIALDENKNVCMVSNEGIDNWMLPGGTVEKNENLILALRRELQEEADIEIRNYKLIGFLEMKSVNNITNYIWSRTEMWFVAKVTKILPQTEDPAVGFVLHRDFFTIEEMAHEFVRYGKISDFLVDYLKKLKI